MNKIILIGRISSELNLRYTPKGKAVCEFNLAVNRIGSEGTDFFTCVVWNKQAENLVNFNDKGSMIALEGTSRVDKYKNDKDENRYKNYVLVNTIQFLDKKKEITDTFKEVENKYDIDENLDLPF